MSYSADHVRFRAGAGRHVTAWLAPLPPKARPKSPAMTVSPGRGNGDPYAVRSALMLPTTATPRLATPASLVIWVSPKVQASDRIPAEPCVTPAVRAVH